MLEDQEWVHCPVCGNKTRIKVREDSILINFPLFCPKCKQESLVVIKDKELKVIKEPAALS